MSSGDFAIETEGLTKRFGERTAISDVDLRVSRGCAFGYLGPNGAGVAIAALLAWQFIVVPLVVHLRLDSVFFVGALRRIEWAGNSNSLTVAGLTSLAAWTLLPVLVGAWRTMTLEC